MEFLTEWSLLAEFDFAGLFSRVASILGVVLGLGLVIFFHELGHFAVAKWCNVNVERFSIGFGPILWSRKKGETEYALSAIPFGGYVKMLGQDDLDPSQLSSEDIARDPRSYSSKSVAQRMAIISAGVIMNIITGLLFFAIAFSLGVPERPAEIGTAIPGSPAWKAGLRPGDTIDRINDRRVDSWEDITRAVILSSGALTVHGRHEDGAEFSLPVHPDAGATRTRRVIGVAPIESLTLRDSGEGEFLPAIPGTPAARTEPALAPGDVVREAAGERVESVTQLRRILAQRRSEPVEIVVERGKQRDEDAADGEPAQPERLRITLATQRFLTLGLWTDIGPIDAVRKDTPADQAGLRPDDRILEVDGQELGKELDPLRLPDLLAARAGEPVEIRVSRKAEGDIVALTVVPTSTPGWTSPPRLPDTPLEIPSIGATVRLIPMVMHVEPGGPAEKAGIRTGEEIVRMRLFPPKKEGAEKDPEPIVIGPKERQRSWWSWWSRPKEPKEQLRWGHAFWALQLYPEAAVELDLKDSKGEPRTVSVKPVRADDWFNPDLRGMMMTPKTQMLRSANAIEAIGMGYTHTRNTIADIYLTLRSLFGGGISPKELHGPVGIAGAAYSMARQGFAALMLFLGFLSVNLAVLNFLPIPVLDGGHMVFLIWEGVTRKKPSERVLVTATYIGMAFVLSLMVFVLYLDIFYHR